jgi:hypothetical protein
VNYEIFIFISTKSGLEPARMERRDSRAVTPAWCFDFRTREGKMINYNMEPAVSGANSAGATLP